MYLPKHRRRPSRIYATPLRPAVPAPARQSARVWARPRPAPAPPARHDGAARDRSAGAGADRRHRPGPGCDRCPSAISGSSITVGCTIGEHRRPAGPTPHGGSRPRACGEPMSSCFSTAAAMAAAPLPPGSSDAALRPGRRITAAVADGPSGAIAGRGSRDADAALSAPRQGLAGAGCERPWPRRWELPSLPEWQDRAFLRRRRWPAWPEAVAALHNRATAGIDVARARARRRLAYDELLASQLAHQLIRAGRERGRRALASPARRACDAGSLAALPFRLTAAQARAIGRNRWPTWRHRRPMLRLLHGRCRQRQDAGRDAGDARSRRGRRPGRADGADRAAGPPARRHARIAPGRRSAWHRIADRRRPAAAPTRRCWTELAVGRCGRRRRHARAVSGGRGRSGISPWPSSTSSIASACISAWA